MNDGTRVAVFGKSGSGKTAWVKKEIAKTDRLIIFDPEGEYSELKGVKAVESLRALLKILSDNHDSSFRVAFVAEPEQEQKQLHQVCRLIEKLQQPFLAGTSNKKITLVVDELNLSYPNPPRSELNGFSRLASRGRKRGINLIGITQRPAEIGTRFRGNLDCIVCFSLSLPNDWAVIREIMGADAEKQVKELKKYGFLLWTQEGWEVKQ